MISDAIGKHGWESFKKEVLMEGFPIEEMNHWEKEMIRQHMTVDPDGYNLRHGGGVGEQVMRKSSFDPTAPRGPRSEETVAKLMAVAEAKREAKLALLDPKKAESIRHNAVQRRKHDQEKKLGIATDGRLGPSARRTATWDAKREAKLALMDPEEAEKIRYVAKRHAIWLQKKLAQKKQAEQQAAQPQAQQARRGVLDSEEEA